MAKSGPRPGRDAMKKSFSASYFGPDGKPFQVLSFDQLAVHVLGAEHAYSTGHWALQGGGRPNLGGWFTLIWAHDASGWRVIHDHTS